MATKAASKASSAELQADSRPKLGKGSARELRRGGYVPATVYGKGLEPLSIALSQNALELQVKKGRFRTTVLNLKLDGKETIKALPKDIQTHPVSDKIEHVDFIRVVEGTMVHVAVPVHFLNMEKSVGIKRGGVLNIVRHRIELVCKPDAIPTSIDIDIANLDIGHSIHIKDVKLPEGVAPQLKRNFTIAALAGRRAEVEEAPVAAAATAVAAAPAAGAAAPTAAAAATPAADAKKDEKKK